MYNSDYLTSLNRLSLKLTVYYYLFPPIYSDIMKIHDGLGAKLSIFVQWVSTFFAGFIVAFVTNWELTLFMVFLAPFLVATGAISAKVSIPNSQDSFSKCFQSICCTP